MIRLDHRRRCGPFGLLLDVERFLTGHHRATVPSRSGRRPDRGPFRRFCRAIDRAASATASRCSSISSRLRYIVDRSARAGCASAPRCSSLRINSPCARISSIDLATCLRARSRRKLSVERKGTQERCAERESRTIGRTAENELLNVGYGSQPVSYESRPYSRASRGRRLRAAV